MSEPSSKAMGEIMDKYFEEVRQAMEQNEGGVVEFGMEAMRFEALSQLFPFFFLLLAGIAGLAASWRYRFEFMHLSKAMNIPATSRSDGVNEQLEVIFGIRSVGVDESTPIPEGYEQHLIRKWREASLAVGAVSVFSIAVSCFSLLNFWAWVGLFYPNLYAIHLFVL